MADDGDVEKVSEDELLAAMKKEKRGRGAGAVSAPDIYKEPWELADEIDEKQIVAEVVGNEEIKEYVYSFQSRGATETGLTWAGVQAVVQKLREDKKLDLTIISVETQNTPDAYAVTVMCKDRISDVVMPGGAEQLKLLDNGKRDKHAYPKAMTKAVRNSFQRFLPVPIIKAMIKEYYDRKMRKKMGGRR